MKGLLIIIILAVFAIAGMIENNKPSEEAIAARDMEIQNLRVENFKLKHENNFLQRFKNDIDEQDMRIAQLESRGYKPDELVVRYLQRVSRRTRIPAEFADRVLQTESSYWSNTNGAAGEFGGFQILPTTLMYYLAMLGVDTSKVKYEDYMDLRTNTEWAYFFFFELRMHKKRLDWNDYNRGWFEADQPITEKGFGK